MSTEKSNKMTYKELSKKATNGESVIQKGYLTKEEQKETTTSIYKPGGVIEIKRAMGYIRGDN